MSHDDHTQLRPWRRIDRRKSRQIMVGNVPVGGDAPITVQSMSCPDVESTAALSTIVKASKVPIVADIHFHYRRGIEAAKAGAACLRINPGNIGSPDRVREVIQAARDHGCSMRIGVNAGSLERELLEKYGEPCPDAMVESALSHARILQDHDFHDFKISVKASDIFMTVAAYQQLADAIDCPLHLGITEAGALRTGTVKSAIGMGSLLWAGIGDTIRVSLAADPVEEIKVGFDLLKSLGLRHRGVNIIACPSCARQGFNVIKTVEALEERLAHVATPLSLSIIGCVVNGPGEALMTDLGFTGGGKGSGMVYVAGRPDHKLDNDTMVDHIVGLVEARAAEIEAEKARALQAAE
jgi:(E)-4-hydroxy-3-methylbut-2-enyl-diphosphate synthase